MKPARVYSYTQAGFMLGLVTGLLPSDQVGDASRKHLGPKELQRELRRFTHADMGTRLLVFHGDHFVHLSVEAALSAWCVRAAPVAQPKKHKAA